MRKLFVLVLSAAAMLLVGAGSSIAAEGDRGKACPSNSPAGERATPPNCGEGKGGDNGDKGDKGNPPCDRGQAGTRNPNCPDGGGNGGGGNGDVRACEGAELTLFRDLSEDAPTVLCLFAPGNAEATDNNCPEGTFLGGTDTGAICLLPAEQEALTRLL